MKPKQFSPSGRYYMTTESIPTQPGRWSYTRARIYRTDSEETEPIIEITRNYSSIWVTWIENHAVTGNDYLLTGEDYQGQTIINLTTGVKRSWLPEAAKKGFGWCISNAKWLPEHQWIQATGCFWASSEEERFFDLSDPDNAAFEQQGWPEPTQSIDLDSDATIELQADKTLTETHYALKFRATGEWEYEIRRKETELYRLQHIAERTKLPEDEQAWKTATAAYEAIYGVHTPSHKRKEWEAIPIVRFTYVLNTEGVYELQEEWESEIKLLWDKEREVIEAKKAQETAKVRDNDVFYAEIQKLAQQLGTKLSMSMWCQSQIDAWDGNPNVYSFDVYFTQLYPTRPNQERYVSIRWGCAEGPLQLSFTSSEEQTQQEFERSLAGWQQLIEAATTWIQLP